MRRISIENCKHCLKNLSVGSAATSTTEDYPDNSHTARFKGCEADGGWELTGTVPHPVVVCVVVHWVVTGAGARAVTDAAMLWESQWFLETFWSFQSLGNDWSWRECIYQSLVIQQYGEGVYRPGPVDRVRWNVDWCHLVSAVTNMSISGVLKAENRLFKVLSGRRHYMGMGLSRRDSASAVRLRTTGRCVGTSIVANLFSNWNNSCGTEIENVSPPVCEYRPLLCFCRNTHGLFVETSAGPNDKWPSGRLPVPEPDYVSELL